MWVVLGPDLVWKLFKDLVHLPERLDNKIKSPAT